MSTQKQLRLPTVDYFIWFAGRLIGLSKKYIKYSLVAIISFVLVAYIVPGILGLYVNAAMLMAMAGCFRLALWFDSRRSIAWNDRNWNSIPLSKYPHPIVNDILPTDSPGLQARKRAAIIRLEAKAYAASAAMLFLGFYSVLTLYNIRYLPYMFHCDGRCDATGYLVKCLGSGILFDFFDDFAIHVTNVEPSYLYTRTLAFVAKLVETYILIRTVTVLLNFRQKYLPVFRSEGFKMSDFGGDKS